MTIGARCWFLALLAPGAVACAVPTIVYFDDDAAAPTDAVSGEGDSADGAVICVPPEGGACCGSTVCVGPLCGASTACAACAQCTSGQKCCTKGNSVNVVCRDAGEAC